MAGSGNRAAAGALHALGVNFTIPGLGSDPGGGDPGLAGITAKIAAVHGRSAASISMPPLHLQDAPVSTFFDAAVAAAGRAPAGATWGFVDPLSGRLPEFWRGVFAAAKVDLVEVFVVRHPWDVLASAEAQTAIDEALIEEIWIQHVIEALRPGAVGERLVLTYDDLVDIPETQLARLALAAGLEGDPGARADAGTALDPSMRHSRFGLSENEPRRDRTLRLYQIALAAGRDRALGKEDLAWLRVQRDHLGDRRRLLMFIETALGRSRFTYQVLEHSLVIERMEHKNDLSELRATLDRLSGELDTSRRQQENAERSLEALEAEYLLYRSLARHRAADLALGAAERLPGWRRLRGSARARGPSADG